MGSYLILGLGRVFYISSLQKCFCSKKLQPGQRMNLKPDRPTVLNPKPNTRVQGSGLRVQGFPKPLNPKIQGNEG